MSGQPAGEELPYIGSKISLISISDIRYEGILDSIDPLASTVSLRFVQSFGTEGRPVASPVAPANEVYNCIVFQGKHIKDLTVCSEPEPPAPPMAAYPADPAIVSVDLAGASGGLGGRGDPGSAPLLRQGMGGPNGPAPVFGDLGVSPNEMAEACCAPGSPNTGPLHQPHLQLPRGADGLMNFGPGAPQGRHPNYPGARGGGPGGSRGGIRGGGPQRGRGGKRPPRGGHGDHHRGVVGELQSRPNAQLKSELAEEFDFDAMNSKFEKPATLGEEAAELPTPGTAYDKNVSFFDSISCEALDKRAGAQQQQTAGSAEDDRGRRTAMRQQNRALDVDTFGEGAANYNPRYMNRRGGRGRGRGFSRGGGMGRGRGRGGSHQQWTQRSKPQEVEG